MRGKLPVKAWLPTLTEHRALRRHPLSHILPGLALYQVLREDHAGDQQAALDEIARVFRAWTEAQFRSGMRVLRAVLWQYAVVTPWPWSSTSTRPFTASSLARLTTPSATAPPTSLPRGLFVRAVA